MFLNIYQNKLSSRFSYKENKIVLTLRRLLEDDFSQNWLNVYDKMVLPIRMRIICNVKHYYTIRLKY